LTLALFDIWTKAKKPWCLTVCQVKVILVEPIQPTEGNLMSNRLSQPLTLPCGVVLPNRIVKGAMTEGLADVQNRATPKHALLYERWAKGGSGVLLTGNVQVHRDYLERPGNIVIEGPQSLAQISALSKMAEAATDNGAHIWMQISHAGRQTPASVAKEPVAPSSISVTMPGGQFGKPRALSGDEILDIIERFSHVAGVAKDTGFSGVQIHGAHGYLVSEFLSPRVNQRDDEWGGSLENRARLLLRIIEAVRAKVGPTYPIAVKLNSSDFQKGGFSFEDCLQVVRWLEEAGIDALEISGGSYEQPSMMGVEGPEPVFDEKVQESTRAREAYFLDYANQIRKGGLKVPLMVTGGFRTGAAMAEALDGGGVDLIGVARPLCAEPDGPNKLLSDDAHVLRAWENQLRLGPWFLSPSSPIGLIKTINTLAAQAWFCLQILRMGEGLDPDTGLGAFKALRGYMKHEANAAAALTKQRELA
jgi:2,4-dienoyl-CoA reductase-like NADH-dependent reductase (Old Yellow Enzyme family)